MGKYRTREQSLFRTQELNLSKDAFTLKLLDLFCVSGILKEESDRLREHLLKHAKDIGVEIFFHEHYQYGGKVCGKHTWKLDPDYVGIYVYGYDEARKWEANPFREWRHTIIDKE